MFPLLHNLMPQFIPSLPLPATQATQAPNAAIHPNISRTPLACRSNANLQRLCPSVNAALVAPHHPTSSLNDSHAPHDSLDDTFKTTLSKKLQEPIDYP